jgi:hypothetical protein
MVGLNTGVWRHLQANSAIVVNQIGWVERKSGRENAMFEDFCNNEHGLPRIGLSLPIRHC